MNPVQNPPAAGQKIHLHILRYNPADPASVPHCRPTSSSRRKG